MDSMNDEVQTCSYCHQRPSIGIDPDGGAVCQECNDPAWTPEATKAFDRWYHNVGFLYTADEGAAIASFMAGRRSLLAERDALRVQLDGMTEDRDGWRDAANNYKASRDALDSQMRDLTTEWGATVVGKGPIEAEDEDHARAVSDGPIRKRLVGPWVEVE